MFKNIILQKGFKYGLEYHYYPKQDTLSLYISEERINEDDLANGITHEITEAFLRKLVKEIENYFLSDAQMEDWSAFEHKRFEEPFHAVATLSGDRYDLVAHYYDYLEEQFRKAQLSHLIAHYKDYLEGLLAEAQLSHSSHPKDGFFKS